MYISHTKSEKNKNKYQLPFWGNSLFANKGARGLASIATVPPHVPLSEISQTFLYFNATKMSLVSSSTVVNPQSDQLSNLICATDEASG